MPSILPLYTIDDMTSTIQPREERKNRGTFVSVLEKEIILQAVPEYEYVKASIPAGTTSGTGVDSPKGLQPYFERAARAFHVDINLLKAVAKAESDFDPNCVSSAGAVGVMQLMPSTAATLGVKNAYDPEDNIMGGAKYLSSLSKMYGGDLSLTLAAYNAGSGNVEKYGGIPPFSETQSYVKRVLSYYGDPSSLSLPDTQQENILKARPAADSPSDIYTISAQAAASLPSASKLS